MPFDALNDANLHVLSRFLPDVDDHIAGRLDLCYLLGARLQISGVLRQIEDDNEGQAAHQQLPSFVHAVDFARNGDVALLQVGNVGVLGVGKHYLAVRVLHDRLQVGVVLAEDDLVMVGGDLHGHLHQNLVLKFKFSEGN